MQSSRDLVRSPCNDRRQSLYRPPGDLLHEKVHSRCIQVGLSCLPASWKDRGLSGKSPHFPLGCALSIAPDSGCFAASEAALGDSISICGCCLTVVAIHDGMLDFEAGEETLSKTNLGAYQVGRRVNLERSLAANARLGGHFVQGHVDGVATVSRNCSQWRMD